MSSAADNHPGRTFAQDVARRLETMAIEADEHVALSRGLVRTATTPEAAYRAGYDAAWAAGFRDACQQVRAGLLDGLAASSPDPPDHDPETEE